MVKTEIKIVDFKDTSAIRTSFSTENHGKMSAFKNEGSTLIADLKANANKYIIVDVDTNKKDDKTYYNIRTFHGLSGETYTPPGETIAETIDPKDLALIKEHNGDMKEAMMFKQQQPIVAQIEDTLKRKSVKGSAYEKDPIGLAVEIVCSMFAYVKNATVNELPKGDLGEAMMDKAIKYIKQAQKAFS